MVPSIDVKTFRENRGWSKGRLAAELGVDASTVWRWENGKRKRPIPRPVVKALERLSDEFPPVKTDAAA